MKSGTKIYVVGGQAKERPGSLNEWQRFKSALLLEIDLEGKSLNQSFSYKSPINLGPTNNQSQLFKAATLEADVLTTCTNTEIVQLDLTSGKILQGPSLPCFNDLHHVLPTKRDTFLVVSTGLDMVAEIDPKGILKNSWDVLGQDTWAKFSKDIDYRLISTTKPHASHPNFVFEFDGEIWATRFIQEDAICLTDQHRRINIGVGGPHDGIVRGDYVYFTTVNGQILKAAKDGEVVQAWNVEFIFETIQPLGWCRGLCFLDDNKILVGFSRLRRTKFEDSLGWLKTKLGELSPKVRKRVMARTLPTRIACIDLSNHTLEWEIDLEPFHMNAVFSIHVA